MVTKRELDALIDQVEVETAVRQRKTLRRETASHAGICGGLKGIVEFEEEEQSRCNSGNAKAQSGERFSVKSVVYGDGSSIERLTFEDEMWNASGLIDGGIEVFHRIISDSIKLFTQGATKEGNWKYRPVTKFARECDV